VLSAGFTLDEPLALDIVLCFVAAAVVVGGVFVCMEGLVVERLRNNAKGVNGNAGSTTTNDRRRWLTCTCDLTMLLLILLRSILLPNITITITIAAAVMFAFVFHAALHDKVVLCSPGRARQTKVHCLYRQRDMT
jgi:hypothetical protein